MNAPEGTYVEPMKPVYWLSQWTAAECGLVMQHVLQSGRAAIADTSGDYEQTRRSRMITFNYLKAPNQGAALVSATADLCKKAFGFRVDAIEADVALIAYATGDYFDWHVDAGSVDGPTRKLTILVQLSDPDTYEGGALEFFPGTSRPAYRSRGTVIAFSPFIVHRVTPIRSGTRFSLVIGLQGPRFE